MHPNPAFRQEPNFTNLLLARKRGFGTLCINSDPAPLLSHIPFVIDDAGKSAELHLVRSNPIARTTDKPTPAVISISGPDAYVSPDWYGDPAQVPTWNYVAVHLRGTLHPMDQGLMREHLDRVSAHFEAMLFPKRPWTTAKMPTDVLDRLMRTILPFRFEITEIEGTWKLNQNKTDQARAGASHEIRTSPVGHETAVLAALMMGGVQEIDKR